MAFLKGWKTHLFNGAMIVVQVSILATQVIQPLAPVIGPEITVQLVSALALLQGFGNVVLRELTDGPARSK